MRSSKARPPARNLRAAFFSALALMAALSSLSSPGFAQTPAARSTNAGKSTVATRSHTAAEPRWNQLTPAQQKALAPLASEWDRMDGFRRRKWLTIGNRFSSMKPDEQERLQKRMDEWAKLTPEQRRLARENYARAKRLNRAQKSAQWQKYQQLPEEQKRRLAAAASRKKHLATIPTPAQARNHKTLPPIKSAPKRMLERSVTPGAASASAIEPSPSIQK